MKITNFKHIGMVLLLAALCGGSAYASPALNQEPGKNGMQSSQDGKCSGVVYDSQGLTVIGASVMVKGTQNGVITDLDGKFSLPNVKKGDVLVISFIGYKTIELTWDGKPINVTMEDDAQLLGEVVVTALGLPKQAKSVGYATSRVSTAEIERARLWRCPWQNTAANPTIS